MKYNKEKTYYKIKKLTPYINIVNLHKLPLKNEIMCNYFKHTENTLHTCRYKVKIVPIACFMVFSLVKKALLQRYENTQTSKRDQLH